VRRPILAAFALAPLALPAQRVAEYRFGADTLRYDERTTGRVTMFAPSGEVVVRTDHDARLALAASGAGRVRGWYERLALRKQGPGLAEQVGDTRALLGRAYALAVSPRGEVRVETLPAIPAPVASMTDLTRQFDDFLVVLPAGQPLRAGTVWVDTLVRTGGGRPDSTTTARHVRRHRVERDTVVGGQPAVVIALQQSVRIDGVAPMPGGAGRMRTHLEGEEDGRAVFVPGAGRLVARERRGTLTGQIAVTGTRQPLELPQRFEYTSTMTLVPARP
jgi:hypothetical protein